MSLFRRADPCGLSAGGRYLRGVQPDFVCNDFQIINRTRSEIGALFGNSLA